MKHLSASEFVDAAEGGLEPSRTAHLETCAACRARSAALGDALGRALAAREDVPEPSPLFWADLSARVREAVDAQVPRGGARPWLGGRSLALAATAILVAAISWGWLARDGRIPVAPAQVATDAPRPTGSRDQAQSPNPVVDAVDAGAWEVLTEAASDVAIEDAGAAGMLVHPAALDRAVQRLSADELTELGRLLQSEMKRSGIQGRRSQS